MEPPIFQIKQFLIKNKVNIPSDVHANPVDTPSGNSSSVYNFSAKNTGDPMNSDKFNGFIIIF